MTYAGTLEAVAADAPEVEAVDRLRWIATGTFLVVAELLVIGVSARLAWRSNIWNEWAWFGASAVLVVLCVTLAAAPARRKGLSLAFFGPLVLVAYVAIHMLTPWPGVIDNRWVAALLAIATLASGGWLVLRGRSGLSWLALAAAPLLIIVLDEVFDFRRSRGISAMPWTDRVWTVVDGILGWDYGTRGLRLALLLFLGAFVFVLLAVVATTWLAALPALGRAEARRSARARTRDADRRAAGSAHVDLARQPVPAGYVPQARTNGMAIASLVLGIVGVSVLAVVFGHVARRQIRYTRQDGGAMAMVGIVLGYLQLAVSLGLILWVVIAVANAT